MAESHANPPLRLVRGPIPADDAERSREETARRQREREVAEANRSASAISPDDTRWIFALRVAEQLDGGRAAVLAPEKRRRLLSLGRRLGLRPFDANLLIAIVQDGARRGESPSDADAGASLRVVGPAEPRRRGWLAWLIATAALTAGIVAALIAWVRG